MGVPAVKSPLYLYIDEAGNFDFSPKGSRHFILTAVVMNRPFSHIEKMASLKYDYLEKGLDEKKNPRFQEFHAANDTQATRDSVFDAICDKCNGIRIYAVIIRKNKTNPSLRSPEALYSRSFDWLIKYVAACESVSDENLVVAVTDNVNFKGKNDALKTALKGHLEKSFASIGAEYRYYQHVSESDVNLQIADYCCWAIQRKWERGDDRSYNLIATMVRNEGDVFKNGDIEYYRFEER